MHLSDKVKAFFERSNSERKSHDVSWVWEFVADPEKLFLVDMVWEYLGKEEVEGALKGWLDLEMTAELKSSVDVHLNALGQGLHTAAATVLSTTARPALDGLWTDTLLRFNFHANDDLKFTRIQIQAADLRTRDFSLRILRALDKEHGVPPGEYKRAKEAFVAAIQAVSKSADRVLDLMDSNVEYIDPFGGVVVGKEEVRKKLDEWYGAGLTDALEPTEVYTPAPNRARAPITFIFGKLPMEADIAQHAPDTDIAHTIDDEGKIVRAASLPVDDVGRAWLRDLAAWIGRGSAAA